MASAHRENRPVTTGEGIEVDLTAYGLHVIPESLGIEATPGELHSTHAPQTREIPEKEFVHGAAGTAPLPPASSSEDSKTSGSHLSRRSIRFLALLIVTIIAVIVLALAIPLAIELKESPKRSSPNNLNSTANSTARVPNKLSTSGALHGTGLALVALDLSDVPDVSLFYQDNNSQIRRLHSIELPPFVGGFPIIASNARNATPLTTLTYPASTGELNSHLYYIDINNTLQELYSTDNFTTWQLGSLGNYNFAASVTSTALTAFCSDHWLGQDGNSSGVRLYYGAPDNQVHELALFPNFGSQYISQSVFRDTNGNGGIASAWWDGPGIGNLYLFDKNNKFQMWSNNFNMTHSATKNTSYGDWVVDPSQTYFPVKAGTALSFDRSNLCFQEVSNKITCSSISMTDGTILPPSEAHPVTGSQLPLQGSALLTWWQPVPGTYPLELNIFYQTENGDIIQDSDTSDVWVNSTLPAK